MGLNFNRFPINSQRWKNAISTRNFYRIRICLLFFKWESKANDLIFPTTLELSLYVKYWTPYSTSKFDYRFFDTPCIINIHTIILYSLARAWAAVAYHLACSACNWHSTYLNVQSLKNVRTLNPVNSIAPLTLIYNPDTINWLYTYPDLTLSKILSLRASM